MSNSNDSAYLLDLSIGYQMPGAPQLNLELLVIASTGEITGRGTFYYAGTVVEIEAIVGREYWLGLYPWVRAITLKSEVNNGFEASMKFDASGRGLCDYKLAEGGEFKDQPVRTINRSLTTADADGSKDADSFIVGGWSTYSCDIDEEAMRVFNIATDGILGINLSPVAVATQIVAGTNYGFFCNANYATKPAFNLAVMVYIYQPLKGGPRLVAIEEVPGYPYGN